VHASREIVSLLDSDANSGTAVKTGGAASVQTGGWLGLSGANPQFSRLWGLTSFDPSHPASSLDTAFSQLGRDGSLSLLGQPLFAALDDSVSEPHTPPLPLPVPADPSPPAATGGVSPSPAAATGGISPAPANASPAPSSSAAPAGLTTAAASSQPSATTGSDALAGPGATSAVSVAGDSSDGLAAASTASSGDGGSGDGGSGDGGSGDGGSGDGGSGGGGTVTLTANDPYAAEAASSLANEPPRARDDNYYAVTGSLLVVSAAEGVLANDQDPDGDPLTAVLESGPATAAEFTLNADGSFVYRSLAGAEGRDEFTYRAHDGQAASDPARVRIELGGGQNTPPVAADDFYEISHNTIPTILTVPPIGVLLNDDDPEGGTLTAILDAGPTNGTLNEFDSDGSFEYKPNASFVGLDTFTYHANDGLADSNIATVTIEVAPKVDLDIGGVTEVTEYTVGGLVVRNTDGNNAPRKTITLDSTAATGNVTLTRSSSKVKVFTAASGGTEIAFNGTDNKFPVGDLPKNLYVEGATQSATMRDVTLTLTHDDDDSDEVKFTVLWVTLSTKHSGSVANDDSVKTRYNSVKVPPSSNLGFQLSVFGKIYLPEGSFLTLNTEFIGSVKPSNFKPADFGGSMKLKRETVATIGNVAGKRFSGPPPNGNQDSEDALAGDDTSLDIWRDDKPQSGGSGGKIYDFDGPGLNAFSSQTQNLIHRFRVNFKFWATYEGTRSSLKKAWYTRMSYKLTGSTDSGTAESATANTLTDTDKNWAANTWVPGAIWIKAGTGAPQHRRIIANTATKITVAEDWVPALDATSQYWVINKTTWVQHNDVAGDNKNADGSTNITWDLQ